MGSASNHGGDGNTRVAITAVESWAITSGSEKEKIIERMMQKCSDEEK